MTYVYSIKIGAMALLFAALSACGGSGENTAIEAEAQPSAAPVKVDVADSTQKLIDLCMADGGSEEICGCNIQALEDALGAEELAKVAELAEQDDDSVDDYLEGLINDKVDIAMKMANSMQKCMGG